MSDTPPDFDKLLTIYGRKPVLEALEDNSLDIFKLHLASSNKSADIIKQITTLAKQRNIDIAMHSKLELSRISKNSRQDQGVALDVVMPNFLKPKQLLNHSGGSQSGISVMAIDGVTNPQNLGMIIRSVCASPMTYLLIPKKGCAKLDSLVIKASAGTLFKASIVRCNNLAETLQQLRNDGFRVVTLSADGEQSIFNYQKQGNTVFIVGSESEGISAACEKLADTSVYIPMNNNVESLNAAVSAALLAFISGQPAN